MLTLPPLPHDSLSLQAPFSHHPADPDHHITEFWPVLNTSAFTETVAVTPQKVQGWETWPHRDDFRLK